MNEQIKTDFTSVSLEPPGASEAGVPISLQQISQYLESLRQKGQGSQLEQVLSDPQAARRLLESPQGRSLLGSLGLLGPKP